MGNAEVKMQAPSAESQIPYTIYDAADGLFATSDGTAEATIRFAAEGPASEARLPAMTVPQAFKAACAKRGDKVAMQTERPCPQPNGKVAPPALPIEDWTKWTYDQYYAECEAIAKALIAVGHEVHDSANIFGFNSPEWFMAEVGTILAGGKAAGIYPTDTPEQIAFKAEHSGASVMFLEDEGKLAKFIVAAKTLPHLKAVVCWGCAPAKVEGPNGDVPCYTWDEFKKLGEAVPDADLAARIAGQKPGHCCALIYTSGTTGQPKAVMITHDNILAEAALAANEMPRICAKEEQERVLSYLPLSHVAGMLVDIVMPIYMTGNRPGWITCSFARQYDLKLGSVGDRLRAVKPTMFLGVPRVWEKIAEKLKAIGAQTTGMKKTIATWAKKLSLEHQNNCQLGNDGYVPFGHSLANKLVLSKIKAALGLDCCKFGFTGAAPITKATLEYFGQLGIQINEVYGMSENTGATTWSTDACHVWGSCGYELPGTEVKIFRVSETDLNDKTECPKAKDMGNLTEDEKGEVCFRGRHIMLGYMANPKLGEAHVATINKKLSEAVDAEGWLHSGDQGAIDVRGMVKITGRYKELIIGAGGENIAPVPFEDRVKELCPAISNFLMIGDQRKFNVALVTLKCVGATGESPGTDELDGNAAKVDPAVTTIAQAAGNEAYIKMITDAIIATNKDGTACPMNAAKVQKFTILPYDFSVEGGELTPTLKTKRSVVDKTFLAQIDAMYASKDTFVNTLATSGGGAAAAE